MPPKKLENNNEQNIIDMYRELLKTVTLDNVVMADDYVGDDLKDFCQFCFETYHNKFFAQIIKGFVYAQCMLTAEKGTDADTYNNGKLIVNGIKVMEEYFKKYANLYKLEYLDKSEDFDPHASFGKSKV